MAEIQLYQKQTSDKGRVRYVPWSGRPGAVDLDDRELVTLTSSIIVCYLEQVRNNIPAHARLSREMADLQDRVVQVASLAKAMPLDADMIQAGVLAWNGMVSALQHSIESGKIAA